MSNQTCNTLQGDITGIKNELPIAGHTTFHNIIFITELVCVILTSILSISQISRHALNYTRPSEQKYILRILFMVPLYSLTNLLSTKFLPYSTYFLLLSSSYAAIAIASYFSLLCHYLAPDKNYASFFSKVEPQPWQNFFPLPLRWLKNCFGGERGCLGTLNCGVKWFNIMSFGVFQYCLVRALTAVGSVIAQPFGRYCASSLNPVYGHIWVLTLNALSATIAMYCLDEFTWQMKDELRPHKPTLKLWCVKIVFAVSMYQNLILALITTAWIPSKTAVRATSKIAYPDLRVGIPALMLCCELLFTSILHMHAFSWKVYDVRASKENYGGGFLGTRAILDALNVCDLARACGGAVKWLLGKEKGGYRTEQDATESNLSTVLLESEKLKMQSSESVVECGVEDISRFPPAYTKIGKDIDDIA